MGVQRGRMNLRDQMKRNHVLNRQPKANPIKLLILAAVAAVMLCAHRAEAQAQPIRIMPLGDSLTSSLDGQASYRYWLYKQLQANGYNVTFVGSLWGVGDGVSGIYSDFPQYHEGHPGATTDDILQGARYWMQQARPQIVLLLIGANDFQDGQTALHGFVNTHRIIVALQSVNPYVSVLVAMIPPLAGQRAKDQYYDYLLYQYAPYWSTRYSPVRVVDLWSGFLTWQDTLDGQHPNVLGEKIYANRFFQALRPTMKRFGQ
jgi:acyl-CoA thioesterase I